MKLKRIYRLGFTAPILSTEEWNAIYDSFYSITSDNSGSSKYSSCKWRLKVFTGDPLNFESIVNQYLTGGCSVSGKGKNYVQLYFGKGKSGCAADMAKGKVWNFLQNIKNKGKIVDMDDTTTKTTESGATVTAKKSSADVANEAAAAQAAANSNAGDGSISQNTMYIMAAMAIMAAVLIILKM